MNPECDDNNACTDDACSGGVCQHTNADANACTDGIACTNDACSNGTCVSTSACPVGRTCNLGNGLVRGHAGDGELPAGYGRVYAGAVDTFIHAGVPTTNNGAAATLIVDGAPPAPDDEAGPPPVRRHLRVARAGRSRTGATITSASLAVNVTNASWTQRPASTGCSGLDGARGHVEPRWNERRAADGVESVAAADATSRLTERCRSAPLQTITVTAILAAWSAARREARLGLRHRGGRDSSQFDSAEGDDGRRTGRS